MKKKVLLILLPILLIIGGIAGGTYYVNDRFVDIDTIYEGISIEEIPLEGLTKEEALELVKSQKEEEVDSKEIDLVYEDYSHTINLKDLEYTYNYEEIVDEAFEIGREGGFFQRIRIIRDLPNNPENLTLTHTYNESHIDEIVENVGNDLKIEPTNATISISSGNIQVSEDKTGREINKEELIAAIKDSVETLENVEIPVKSIEAKVTKDFLGQINGVIGSYSTSFKGSSSGRIHNIKLSAESLNDMLILPGEEVSYNETTGPRQAQSGYQEAPVIVNGELTPGLGGGVCQSSTTLYNALLDADLLITERSPHSIPPNYVPKGRDGAVATGYLDLKFKNDYDFPIYLKSQVVGNEVEFYVYGDTTVKDYTVKIEPEVVETVDYKVQEQVDNNAPAGSKELVQEGRTGYRVRTYKSIIKDGQVIEKEEISYDYYPARDTIYKVGPKR